LLGGNRDQRQGIARSASRAALVVVREDQDLLVLAEPAVTVVDLGQTGLLIGDLFSAGGTALLGQVDAAACAAITRSRGVHLVEAYWGAYVAFLAGQAPGVVDVVRAPLGRLPCLFTSHSGMTAIASDVAMLMTYELVTPRVDWGALARHLLAGELRRDETCLAGVRELRGGERLQVVDATPSASALWSPWRYAGSDHRLDDPREAAGQVRDVARRCIAARVPISSRSLVLLSGGLDSSIVAACLAHAGRDFTCLNVVTSNPTGDERLEAGKVAARLGRRIVERSRQVANVDLRRSSAATLPRPVARSFEQDSLALARAAAMETGAALIIDGGGGDNVFCSLQSAAPAADCLLVRDAHRRFWKTAREIGRLADTNLWTVAQRAWVRSRRKDRSYRWPADRRFLARGVAEGDQAYASQLWLKAPADALPGKAAHIAMLAAAQGLVEDGDFQTSFPVLVAQPLVETCLRIPSWLWFDRSCNRAVARYAFAPELPAEIAWRRTKGTPDSFVVELFEANRCSIAALLLDGTMAAHGLLDLAAIKAVLDDPRPTMGHDYVRIMQLVDAEVWARGW